MKCNQTTGFQNSCLISTTVFWNVVYSLFTQRVIKTLFWFTQRLLAPLCDIYSHIHFSKHLSDLYNGYINQCLTFNHTTVFRSIQTTVQKPLSRSRIRQRSVKNKIKPLCAKLGQRFLVKPLSDKCCLIHFFS